MSYLSLFLLVTLVWRHVFRNGVLPNVTMRLKIAHALAFIFIACICWYNFSLAIWIILHPLRWLPALAQQQHVYPTWIEIVFQSVESTIGSAELFCCYFTLRGRERARRLMLRLLPVIFVCLGHQ